MAAFLFASDQQQCLFGGMACADRIVPASQRSTAAATVIATGHQSQRDIRDKDMPGPEPHS